MNHASFQEFTTAEGEARRRAKHHAKLAARFARVATTLVVGAHAHASARREALAGKLRTLAAQASAIAAAHRAALYEATTGPGGLS